MPDLWLTNSVGPLRVSTGNARYFINGSGNPVYLAGFHTWYDVQDGGGSDPPSAFDWDEYISALLSYGCNFTKLWAMETGRGWSDLTDQWFSPPRYERTGPGNDNDGKLKFDLTKINEDYLTRLEARATECNNKGIYVCIQFFQGWQIEQNKGGTGDPTSYHPYLLANNINSVDGDNNDDSDLDETHWPAAQGNNTLAYQEDLIEAIIDRLGHLDNIIYEISNEDTDDASGYNTDWQEYLISHITTYESGKDKQHPIGMTKQWPDGEDSTLDASGADWVSYSTTKADDTHSASDPVSMYDTDHTVGLSSDFTWIWESLCRGHGGAWYMDEWDGALYGSDRRNNATYIKIRDNLGYALAMANDADLLNMSPQDGGSSPCATGYCLYGNSQYICWQSADGAFNLDLTGESGTFNVYKRNSADGTTNTAQTVDGGAVRSITQPSGWTTGWACRVYK